MYMTLRVLRGIAGLLLALQLFQLVPAIIWPPTYDAEMPGELQFWYTSKIVFTVFFAITFFGLRLLINWIHRKRTGEPHPALAKKTLAL